MLAWSGSLCWSSKESHGSWKSFIKNLKCSPRLLLEICYPAGFTPNQNLTHLSKNFLRQWLDVQVDTIFRNRVADHCNSHMKIACKTNVLQSLCEYLWAFWQPLWCRRLSCWCRKRTPASLCQMPLVPVAFLFRKNEYINVLHISHILYIHTNTYPAEDAPVGTPTFQHRTVAYCSVHLEAHPPGAGWLAGILSYRLLC